MSVSKQKIHRKIYREEVCNLSRCKNCGALIEWLRTDSGRSVPIDPEPIFIIENDGNERFYTDEGKTISGRQALPDEPENKCEVAFIPHWSTCPNST